MLTQRIKVLATVLMKNYWFGDESRTGVLVGLKFRIEFLRDLKRIPDREKFDDEKQNQIKLLKPCPEMLFKCQKPGPRLIFRFDLLFSQTDCFQNNIFILFSSRLMSNRLLLSRLVITSANSGVNNNP